MSSGGKKTPTQSTRTAPTGDMPRRAIRIVVSLVLVWHLLVLLLYPLANSRTSETVGRIAQSPWLRWYADPLYLNQGYGFFGPDPPQGFLVKYEVYDEQGDVVAEGQLPDRQQHWPRLLYHRYKMLADQLEHPAGEPRVRYVLERYAHHLIRVHDGQSAQVEQVLHRIVPLGEWLGDPERGIDPKPVDHESLYETLVTVRQTRADADEAQASAAEEQPTPTDAEPIAPGVSP